MDIQTSIEATRREFEKSFRTGSFYNRQTQDEKHLQQILDVLPIREGMKILDLGVGSGYMAFPIAEKYRTCEVVGLDIVEQALAVNRERAKNEELENVTFVSYDGIHFPFENESFDLVITRYALHHFPDIQHSIEEVARVLRKGGAFFLSDPCPNDCDETRFVDAYMQLKKDGHIRFYTSAEWESICGAAGFCRAKSFQTSIRFPKKKDTAYGYEELLRRYDRRILESYGLAETETEIFVTENVNNILYARTK